MTRGICFESLNLGGKSVIMCCKFLNHPLSSWPIPATREAEMWHVSYHTSQVEGCDIISHIVFCWNPLATFEFWPETCYVVILCALSYWFLFHKQVYIVRVNRHEDNNNDVSETPDLPHSENKAKGGRKSTYALLILMFTS